MPTLVARQAQRGKEPLEGGGNEEDGIFPPPFSPTYEPKALPSGWPSTLLGSRRRSERTGGRRLRALASMKDGTREREGDWGRETVTRSTKGTDNKGGFNEVQIMTRSRPQECRNINFLPRGAEILTSRVTGWSRRFKEGDRKTRLPRDL